LKIGCLYGKQEVNNMFGRKAYKAAAGALAVAALALAGRAYARQESAPASAAPPYKQPAGTAGLQAQRGPERMVEILSAILDLSPAQTTQIRSILQNSRQNAQPLLMQLQQQRQQLRQAVVAGQTTTAALQPVANQLGQTVSQLALLHAQTWGQVLNVLTPAQRAKAEKLQDLFHSRAAGMWMGQEAAEEQLPTE
jgi:Spy/CpxP family protein refolding chaperone